MHYPHTLLSRWKTKLFATAVAAALCLPHACEAQSYMLKNLYTFNGNDSQFPSNLTMDGQGNLYGVAIRGGQIGYTNNGIVYKFTPTGVMSVLAAFDGLDGDAPTGSILIDSNGNIWGTTYQGGVDWHPERNHFGFGTVFRISAAGVFTPGIIEFNGPHGANPIGDLLQDPQGNVVGITYQGGDPWDPSLGNFGTGSVFTVSPSAVLSNAALFNGGNGAYPQSGPTMDAQGNIYGTTFEGGTFGCGTLYRLSPGGVMTVLANFDRVHGKNPSSSVTMDGLGNLYGTTQQGGITAINGAINGYGTIWKYSAAGGLQTLANFNGANGMFPNYGVTIDTQGNLFGTASNGGATGNGVVFEYSATGILSVLANFDGVGNGSYPKSALALDNRGILYGVTNMGGPTGHGMLFAVQPVASSPMALSSVSVNTTPLQGGASTQGTVRLSTAAPAGGVVVTLGSSNSQVVPQGPVTIPAGAASVTFTISTQAVTNNTGVLIQARLGASTKQASLTVLPPASASLALIEVSPDIIQSGTTSTGRVTLNRVAPAGGIAVRLASDSTLARVPASVTIPAGSTAASFLIATQPVSSSTSVTITATLGTTSLQYFPLITPPLPYSVAMTSVNLSTVQGQTPLIGRVMLSRPAGPGGITVALSSNSPSVTVPASVTVPEGVGIAGFPVQTSSVASTVNARITASLAGTTAAAPVTILPPTAPTMTDFTLTPSGVIGGASTQGTITLSTVAPLGGTVIALSPSSAVLGVPSVVAVPEGESSVSFAVTTRPVTTNTTASVKATLGGATRQASVVVGPSAPSVTLTSLTLNPATVPGGTSSTGAINLSGAAPSGGVTVTLTSSAPGTASVPLSVLVPAGASGATFTVTTSAVQTNASVTISASANGITKAVVLSVTAAPPPPADTIMIQKAEYTLSKQQLLVEATSTSASATLKVYVSSTGALIGTLNNNGGGKYLAQFAWSTNPQSIAVKSSLGGSATKAVTPK